MEFISNCLEDTKKFAEIIANKINLGDVILLKGDLGAGKTTFTRFLCDYLGVDDVVCSPSFTIIKEYNSKFGKIYHADLYRIKDESELVEIGFQEILDDLNSIKIIEWPEIAEDYYDRVIEINIKLINEKRCFEVLNL